MKKQVRDLIEAGYVTRKQAAAILGKGDGGNITKLCKDAGVKFIEIPRGTKTTTLFVGVEVVRLFEKMDKQSRPKQEELPARYGGYHIENNKPAPNTQSTMKDEIIDLLCAIDAKLTALLKNTNYMSIYGRDKQ